MSYLDKQHLAFQKQLKKQPYLDTIARFITGDKTLLLSGNIYFASVYSDEKALVKAHEKSTYHVVIPAGRDSKVFRMQPSATQPDELILSEAQKDQIDAIFTDSNQIAESKSTIKPQLDDLPLNDMLTPNAFKTLKKIIADSHADMVKQRVEWTSDSLLQYMLYFLLSPSFLRSIAVNIFFKNPLFSLPVKDNTLKETFDLLYVPDQSIFDRFKREDALSMLEILPTYWQFLHEEMNQVQEATSPAEIEAIEKELNELLTTDELKAFKSAVENDPIHPLRERILKIDQEIKKGNLAFHIDISKPGGKNGKEQFRELITSRFYGSPLHTILAELGGAAIMFPVTNQLSSTDIANSPEHQHFSMIITYSKGKSAAVISIKDERKLNQKQLNGKVLQYFPVACLWMSAQDYQDVFSAVMFPIDNKVGEEKTHSTTSVGYAVSGVNLVEAENAIRTTLTKFHTIPIARNIRNAFGVFFSVMQESDWANFIIAHASVDTSTLAEIACYRPTSHGDPLCGPTIDERRIRHSGDILVSYRYNFPTAQYVSFNFQGKGPFFTTTFTSARETEANGEYKTLSGAPRKIYETLLTSAEEVIVLEDGISDELLTKNTPQSDTTLARILSRFPLKLPDGIRGENNRRVANLSTELRPPIAESVNFAHMANAKAAAYAMASYMGTEHGILRLNVGQVLSQQAHAFDAKGRQTTQAFTLSLRSYMEQRFNEEYLQKVAIHGLTPLPTGDSHATISDLFTSFPGLLVKYLENPTNEDAKACYLRAYAKVKLYSPETIDFTNYDLNQLYKRLTLASDVQIKVIFLVQKLKTLRGAEVERSVRNDCQQLVNQVIFLQNKKGTDPKEAYAMHGFYRSIIRDSHSAVCHLSESHGHAFVSASVTIPKK